MRVRTNYEALIALREKDGQSQAQLAAAAGITRQKLCDIEKGRRPGTASDRKVLAAALNVPLSAIEVPLNEFAPRMGRPPKDRRAA